MKIFGKAADFYRVRIQTLVVDDEQAMDWDESVLYRQPSGYAGGSNAYFAVQAVRVDDNAVFPLKRFSQEAKAKKFKNGIEDLLEELTKNQFEDRFPKQFGR